MKTKKMIEQREEREIERKVFNESLEEGERWDDFLESKGIARESWTEELKEGRKIFEALSEEEREALYDEFAALEEQKAKKAAQQEEREE
jgi:hypothetical protein